MSIKSSLIRGGGVPGWDRKQRYWGQTMFLIRSLGTGADPAENYPDTVGPSGMGPVGG